MRTSIRVLVVDDSALVRQMLVRALGLDQRIEVVGAAKNGFEALEKAKDLDPDVITLDIEMPELDGLEVLARLHRYSSARVVMLSSLHDADTTYQALSLGAVDFVPKPGVGIATSMEELSKRLRRAVRIAARARPVDSAQAWSDSDTGLDERVPVSATSLHQERRESGHGAFALPPIVAIAASTGGPPALERVLSGLDVEVPASYLIVQHLPAGFVPSLARRLDAAGSVRVTVAEEGSPLERGAAYLAPHGTHITVERHREGIRIRLVDDMAPLHGVRPAADPLFFSVAETLAERSIGVVLTGMGSDGAKGLLAIEQAGGATIAQDEESSVVWGMPAAALRAGAVRRTVPLRLVPTEIKRSLRGRT